jgi:hypothetical protein
MPKGYLRNAGFLGFILAVSLVAYQGAAAPPQAPAAGSSPLPDILGLRTGITAKEAYDLLKAYDPGHTVTLEQWTIPQLYGDKPVIFSMNPATTGPDNQIVVSITLPPNPQVVWHVHRAIGRFTSTKPNVLNTLFQKYGTPWNPDPGQPVNSNVGILNWFFDEQGKPVNRTSPADVLALKNCMNSVMSPWNMPGLPTAQGGLTNNTVTQGYPRTTVEPMSPIYDPSANPQCNNLIFVRAQVNGGIVRDDDLTFYMDLTISDYTLQHRTNMALNDKLNAIVQGGAQRERENASKQSVPKL